MKSIELSVPRFQALTGQEEVPLGLQSTSEITLKQELEDVTGKARVYSGHDGSWAGFTCFLKSQLTVSQLQSALHLLVLNIVYIYIYYAIPVAAVIATQTFYNGNNP